MNKLKFYLPAILAMLLIPASSLTLLAQKQHYNDDVEKRIKLVENNLCFYIKVEGEPNWPLETRMKFYNVNGVSIAVIKGYKIEWTKGYGWADSADQRPVTTSTLFQAGSVSKSLNAVSILKLVEEGKLNLFSDINNYLKSWKFPYDSLSHGKIINVANLLNHSAGLTVHGFPGYERGDSIPTLLDILDGKRPANTQAVRSKFEPSLKYEYSGGGITISQLLVQDITKMPYEKFMWQNVLKPIGMISSSFSQPPIEKKENNFATGYYDDGTQVKGKYHIYPEQAAAGLWTNPIDLAKYIIETQLSLHGKSNKILSKEMSAIMLTPYIDSSKGLGVFLESRQGQKYFDHAGGTAGFTCSYWGSFEGGNGVVVMTNMNNNIAIINEIIHSVATIYDWKGFFKPHVIDTTILNSYLGDYEITTTSKGTFNLTQGAIFTISKQGYQLKAQAAGQEKVNIYPASDSVFYPRMSDRDIEFFRNEKEIVTKLVVHQNGIYIECKKKDN